MELSSNEGVLEYTATSRSGSGYGSGFSNTPFTTENSAVFAPIPSASVSTAIAVNPGFFSRTRNPYRTSCQKFVMDHPYHARRRPRLPPRDTRLKRFLFPNVGQTFLSVSLHPQLRHLSLGLSSRRRHWHPILNAERVSCQLNP